MQQQTPNDLRVMPYAQYLRTPHWQSQRQQALTRAKRRCQVCNSPRQLNAHHRTYERRGCERPEDITILCEQCHTLFHEHYQLSKCPRATAGQIIIDAIRALLVCWFR